MDEVVEPRWDSPWWLPFTPDPGDRLRWRSWLACQEGRPKWKRFLKWYGRRFPQQAPAPPPVEFVGKRLVVVRTDVVSGRAIWFHLSGGESTPVDVATTITRHDWAAHEASLIKAAALLDQWRDQGTLVEMSVQEGQIHINASDGTSLHIDRPTDGTSLHIDWPTPAGDGR